MKVFALVSDWIFLAPVAARSQVTDPDPAKIDSVDAIDCRVDAPTFNGFAFSLHGEEKIA
ncbi:MULTISPECIES: hypothetical protein [Methylobacterium]|uniref:hypothetical protein n=1 Tax=Methylobacterium TaxID=407 RepID=UPI00272E0F42|nr:hypothetical protein [Methylobacterium sp.]